MRFPFMEDVAMCVAGRADRFRGVLQEGRSRGARFFLVGVLAMAPAFGVAADPPADEGATLGAELFTREWIPNDSRSHGGDGLGPVFNDSSCVACHNQGGIGGGGPASKNVDIISAIATVPQVFEQQSIFQQIADALRARQPAAAKKPAIDEEKKQALREELKKLHPGFASARSVVLHRSGTTDEYNKWRAIMRANFNHVTLVDGSELGEHAEETAVDAEGATPVPEEGQILQLKQHVMQVAPATSIGGPATRIGIDFDFNASPEASPMPFALHTNSELSAGRTILSQFLMAIAELIAEPEMSLSDAAVTFAMPDAATEISVEDSFPIAAFEPSDFGGFSRQVGNFLIQNSKRNTTALFGAGVIDSIPDSVLEEAARQRFAEFPLVTGRVSRLKDGRIGRFGWKSQKATLRDFTMTACAVELGLHVPEHPQAGAPYQTDYKPTGYDLNQRECDALVSYLRQLPAPAQKQPPTPHEQEYLAGGQRLFTQVGCAACHTPKLGEVDGLYSDLLLHDMGEQLADGGSYGVFVPNTDEGNGEEMLVFAEELQERQRKPTREEEERAEAKAIGARQREWRTAPLWGVRDSSPYLHDGRAPTIETAIAFHGGEGRESAKRFHKLSSKEKLQMIGFLKSLTAP